MKVHREIIITALCLLVPFAVIIPSGRAVGGQSQSGRCILCNLASRVDRDELEKTVRDLSGADSVEVRGSRFLMKTRYTYSGMKFHALEYCRRKAVSYGYAPRQQSFDLPPQVNDIYAMERAGDTIWVGGYRGRVYMAAADSPEPSFRKCSHIAGRGILGLEKSPGGDLFAVCDTPLGSGGAVYRSGDGGNNWEPVYRTDHSLQTVSFMDAQRGIAAGLNGSVIMTSDGGESWSEIDPHLMGYESFYGSDASGGLYRLAGSSGRLFTLEGTESVSFRDTFLCGCFLRDMDFAGPDFGMAVGDSSVFRTADGGTVWNSTNLGVELLSVALADSARAAVGARGGSIFITSDGGANWETVSGSEGERKDVLLFSGRDSLLSAGQEFVTLWNLQSGTAAVSRRWTVADTVRGENLIFSLAGRGDPRRKVIICAHYDSQNTEWGQSPYLTAPGADDNGTGVAGVLECARILKNCLTDYTVEFVLFDGEEEGLHGSRHFAENMDGSQECRAVINLDMIGADYSSGSIFQIAGRASHTDSSLYLLISETAGLLGLAIRPEYLSSSPVSDHRSFWENIPDVPSLLIIEGGFIDNPYYHSSEDTAGNVNYDYCAGVVRAALAAAARVAGYRGEVPEEVLLHGNYPNPFSRNTAIRFELPERMGVRLTVYDVTGRRVAELMNEKVGPGRIQYTWNGKNIRGSDLSSGVYFLRLEVGSRRAARKLVIVR